MNERLTAEQLEAVKVAGGGWCSEQTFSDICEELQERRVAVKKLDVMSLVLRDLLDVLEPNARDSWTLNHVLEPLIARARRILE